MITTSLRGERAAVSLQEYVNSSRPLLLPGRLAGSDAETRDRQPGTLFTASRSFFILALFIPSAFRFFYRPIRSIGILLFNTET